MTFHEDAAREESQVKIVSQAIPWEKKSPHDLIMTRPATRNSMLFWTLIKCCKWELNCFGSDTQTQVCMHACIHYHHQHHKIMCCRRRRREDVFVLHLFCYSRNATKAWAKINSQVSGNIAKRKTKYTIHKQSVRS